MKKVYKLTSPHSNNVYIGKCGGYLSTRYAQHKYYFNKAMELNFKIQEFIEIEGQINPDSPSNVAAIKAMRDMDREK